MSIRLSDMSPLPLREQIVSQIRQMILRGELREHVQLQSIRRLASEQRVGVVTVQRAFEDLEREGLIYARQGKGYFVRPICEESRKTQARDLAIGTLKRPLLEARAMGLSRDEIEELIRMLLDNEGM